MQVISSIGLTPYAVPPKYPKNGDLYFDKEVRMSMVYCNGKWNQFLATGSTDSYTRAGITRLDSTGRCLSCGAVHDGSHSCRYCRTTIYL